MWCSRERWIAVIHKRVPVCSAAALCSDFRHRSCLSAATGLLLQPSCCAPSTVGINTLNVSSIVLDKRREKHDYLTLMMGTWTPRASVKVEVLGWICIWMLITTTLLFKIKSCRPPPLDLFRTVSSSSSRTTNKTFSSSEEARADVHWSYSKPTRSAEWRSSI